MQANTYETTSFNSRSIYLTHVTPLGFSISSVFEVTQMSHTIAGAMGIVLRDIESAFRAKSIHPDTFLDFLDSLSNLVSFETGWSNSREQHCVSLIRTGLLKMIGSATTSIMSKSGAASIQMSADVTRTVRKHRTKEEQLLAQIKLEEEALRLIDLMADVPVRGKEWQSLDEALRSIPQQAPRSYLMKTKIYMSLRSIGFGSDHKVQKYLRGIDSLNLAKRVA